MDNGEVAHLPREAEVGQPGFVVGGKLVARPIDRFLGQLVEASVEATIEACSSWFPFTTGQSSSRMILTHSLGLAL